MRRSAIWLLTRALRLYTSMALLCAVLSVAGAHTARAAGVVGTGTAASCTDAALDAALDGGGLVTFNCGAAPVTIDISSGSETKMISADTTIDGGGLITLSGGGQVRVFSVDSGVNLSVERLTIADGRPGPDDPSVYGGAIDNDDGSLTVINSTFVGNGGRNIQAGGAISSVGPLVVTNSTFSGNRANAFGGAIFIGGSLTVTGSTFSDNFNCGGSSSGARFCRGNAIEITSFASAVAVTNSTFGGNVCPGSDVCPNAALGGGASIANDFSAALRVTNSTFTGNDGGIFSDLGSVLLDNTILAGSLSSPNCRGLDTFTDGGHNLDDGTSCGFSAANGSLSNTNPQLDSAGLHDNGGPTQTVALCTAVGVPAGCTAISPAINAGSQAVCAAAPVNNLDQRGFVRPGTGHTQCSMGAYEADAIPAQICIGDCDASHSVTVNEVVTLVDIVLGTTGPSACPHGIPSGSTVDIALILQAVNHALVGCGG